MTAALDRTLMGELSGFVAERTGLHFPEERWPDLARGLETAGRELGFEAAGASFGWLRAQGLTVREVETLASHLTVGETYFFRDSASFEVLEREILPSLIARRAEAGRTLRLWSAGCCTGEEAYSLAITCARALPDLRAWNVSVLATDINPRFLAKAETGVYGEWSFRGAPGWLRERYFSPAPDRKLTIDPAVKQLVHLAYLNLAEDAYPSLHNQTNAMDVIFCRNVLMYFTPDHQRRVVAALHRCLVDGGYLLVNPAEASAALLPMFAMENAGGAIVFRKGASRPHVGYWPELASPEPALPPAEPAGLAAPAASAAPAAPAAAAPAALAAVASSSTPVVPTSREDLLSLARTHANQGRLEEALTSCRQAIVADRTNPAAHFLHAAVCQELGRLEEAIDALGRVLYLDQDFILAHHALGGLYQRLDQQKKSRRHLAVALTLLLARSPDEIVPESDGMACGRLTESVRAMTEA